MNFLSVTVYVMLAFLLVYRIRYRYAESEDDYYQNFNSLRGLFAIEIVIGHVIRTESTWLYPLGKFMLVSVAFFFFVSGWGLCRSFHQKEGYLRHFLWVKCGFLLSLSIYAFLLRYIIWIVTGNDNVRENIITQYMQRTNWYIWELMFFYILFYFVYRFVPSRLRNILIAMITVILATILFYVSAMQGYYLSAFAFPAGLFFHEYFPYILSFIKSARGKIVVMLMAVLGVFSPMLGMDSLLGMVYFRNMMCLAVLCIMIYFFTYFHPGNIFLKFLGKYSTEIYTYQFMFLAMDEILQYEWPVRLGLVLGLVLLTALVMRPVHMWTKKRLTGEMKRSE